MQTFLPYADFRLSAECLDRQRLGKQRVEAKQIVLAIENGGGWQNHPAVKMWKPSVSALCLYGFSICSEWRRRGYRDSLQPFFGDRIETCVVLPSWFGDPLFHASHKSNLLRKDPAWYGQFGWCEPHDLPYVWPAEEVMA